MKQRDIGIALDGLGASVRDHVLSLVRQYRQFAVIGVLEQSVDTPKRAQTQIAAWITSYNAKNGAGTAQTFLAACLTAAGSAKTLAAVNSDIATLVAQAQALVNHVNNDSWTWDQVATAIEAQFAPAAEADFDYARLPIPAGYVTVWGRPFS